MASSSKKGKFTVERRLFQEKWEGDYFVVPNKRGSTTCLLCREEVTLKKYNIDRHFSTKHKDFNNSFIPGSALRLEKLSSLKRELNKQQNVMSSAVSQDSAVTRASFEVSYMIAKSMKPFTESEMIKECFLVAAEALFEKFNNKAAIISQIKSMQLSSTTCTRRIEQIANHMHTNVILNLRNCKFFR